MSETLNEPKKAEKPRIGSASEKEAEKEDIPAGHVACFVAIPDTVSNGKGVDAQPGEKIIVSEGNADRLEVKGFAFRDQNEAKAAFTGFKRKREQELKEKAEAARKREENRKRWEQDMYGKELDKYQWQS